MFSRHDQGHMLQRCKKLSVNLSQRAGNAQDTDGSACYTSQPRNYRVVLSRPYTEQSFPMVLALSDWKRVFKALGYGHLV